MHSIARRPQDLRDIDGLLDVVPDVNVKAALGWVRNFALAAELPELPREFEELLARRKNRANPAATVRPSRAPRKPRTARDPDQ